MKMKLVLVENDETLCTELKELLAFYNVFDIVHTFDGINEANKYICLNEVDAVFINIKTNVNNLTQSTTTYSVSFNETF